MIRLITDSTSELTKEEQEKLGVTVIPMKIMFEEEEYREGVDINHETFYKKLSETKELPTTSQINPMEFKDIFEPYIMQGDEVIAILMSSKLSGTYQSACIAKEMLETDNIHIIDSNNVSLGLTLLVWEASKLREKGLGAAEIVEGIETLKNKVEVISMVDTLKYLQKGGRVSGAAALLGTALNIKPLIQIKDGKVEVFGKERGQKRIYKVLLEYLHEHRIDLHHGVVYAHTMAKETLAKFIEIVEKEFEIVASKTVCLGSIVGTHIGPGGIGIAYIRE